MSELPADKQKAAWLVALDEMTRAEIAVYVGVSERTLYKWLLEPEFQAEVRRHCDRLLEELVGPAIARLKRTIRKGKDTDANKAIELALKATGILGTEKGGDKLNGKQDQETGVIEIPATEPAPVPPALEGPTDG